MQGPIGYRNHHEEMTDNKRSALAPHNKNELRTSQVDVKNTLLESVVGLGDPWSDGGGHATTPAGELLHPSGSKAKIAVAPLSDSALSARPMEADTPHRSNFGAPTSSSLQHQQQPLPGEEGKQQAQGRPAAATTTTRNRMDRPPSSAVPPRRAPSPTNRIPRVQEGIPLASASSQKHERPKDASGLLPLAAMKSQSGRRLADPAEQEQMLFEQRLCEDALGVAVRKINQYGKANLRYVKCIHLDDFDARNSTRSISSRSAGSWGRRRSPSSRGSMNSSEPEKAKRALVWGKKKDVQIRLDKFTIVRKGKTTDRARRNPSPSSRVLSLLTKDPNHPSLDIEAPTRMDRDKFARAFARFLEIPLESEDSPSVHSADVTPATLKTTPEPSASSSAAGDFAMPLRETVDHPPAGKPPQNPKKAGDQGPTEVHAGGFWNGAVAAGSGANSTRDLSTNNSDYPSSVNVDDTNHDNDDNTGPEAIVELKKNDPVPESDDASAVSSLTGHGYDQELVEELHQALNDLRSELEESRAEAARAVKVAEQAIQSAEKSSSAEWQNTVTHKAAEAAAMAQKKSAEAMAKQRVAEERLEGERRTAAFWRKQAEIAESEAGLLQTRAASAEVQRAAFEEQIESERRLAASRMETMRTRLDTLEMQQHASVEAAMEKNRSLEVEVECLRRELQVRREQGEDVENAGDFHGKNGKRKVKVPGRKKSSDSSGYVESKALLSANGTASNSSEPASASGVAKSEVLKLQAEAALVRQQYEMLRKTTVFELESLPSVSKMWTKQVSQTLGASQDEITRLRARLAVESASRRKLLHEVQDLRGIVRVYCRPKTPSGSTSTISTPSQETLVLHREKFSQVSDGTGPMSFEFDRIFDAEASQRDVFTEIQDVLLSVLDGYKVCVMAYGQTSTGKTKTILGDITTQNSEISIENHGVQLQVMKQLISIAEHRSERFKDTFSLTIVDVHNERVSDLLVGTQAAAARGQVVVADTKRKSQRSVEDDTCSSRPAKLEIRTDVHGETVVQGAISLEIESFEEALQIWEECLANRRNRLTEQEVNVFEYEASAHVISTIQVTSANIATGHGTVGKLQFVDLAGADLVHRQEHVLSDNDSGTRMNSDARLQHRSLETLGEVAAARSQFVRSVPYRNSTLTHLLRDSLEADTKVLLFTCISPDAKDLHETTEALRFAHRMRQVNVGKATKHTISSP